MNEIVTLFSYFPFTNVSLSILPITSTNFFLYFIAFIVTFFLLGFIIGYIINPRRRQRNTKEKPPVDAPMDKQETIKPPGQEFLINNAEQQKMNDSRNQGNRNYYNNYRDYYNSTRRY